MTFPLQFDRVDGEGIPAKKRSEPDLAGRKRKGVGGFKVLVQHLYPGDSRNEGVAYGTLSPFDPHGA